MNTGNEIPRFPLIINGERCQPLSGDYLDVIDPASGEVIAQEFGQGLQSHLNLSLGEVHGRQIRQGAEGKYFKKFKVKRPWLTSPCTKNGKWSERHFPEDCPILKGIKGYKTNIRVSRERAASQRW